LFIDLVTSRSKLHNDPRIELRACNTFTGCLSLSNPSKLAAAKIQWRLQDMSFDPKQASRVAVTFVLAAVFALPQNLLAETASHLVSPSELQQAVVKASAARQQNRDEVQQFLSSEQAQKALKSAHMNPEQVKTAVSTLNDAELAQLASRVHKAQADFAGGTLSDRDLIIIIVAIAALILIIVAVR
jgi:gamma-glutamyl:cysteine ligase YbdK (ATP-grasp superfamily)